jgi:hypothetical protein
VHSATSDLRDLAVFRCSAWCMDTTLIPESRELWITEPLQAPDVGPQGAISLVYQVKIRLTMSSSAASAPLVLATWPHSRGLVTMRMGPSLDVDLGRVHLRMDLVKKTNF